MGVGAENSLGLTRKGQAMQTREEAKQYVANCINAGEANLDEYNIDQICDSLHDIAESWDLKEVDVDEFWDTITSNTYDFCVIAKFDPDDTDLVCRWELLRDMETIASGELDPSVNFENIDEFDGFTRLVAKQIGHPLTNAGSGAEWSDHSQSYNWTVYYS